MFAVIVTGAPGSGKTASLTALSDALIGAEVEHASGDVDELAWSFPFPDLAGRCDHLRAWAAAHRAAGRKLLLVAEVIESREHLGDVLSAVGAGDHLLVRTLGRGGAVPGLPVGISVSGKRLGEGPMHVPPLRPGRGLVDRRTHQRVPHRERRGAANKEP